MGETYRRPARAGHAGRPAIDPPPRRWQTAARRRTPQRGRTGPPHQALASANANRRLAASRDLQADVRGAPMAPRGPSISSRQDLSRDAKLAARRIRMQRPLVSATPPA
jgi:hypothetical protein